MRVIVTGGRDYADRARVFAALDTIHAETPIGCVVQGGARGVDEHADGWTEKSGARSVTLPADWKAHGKAAGPMRNQAMIDAGADLVVAFPGGRGTADCVRRARAAGIRVVEAKP